MLSVAALDSYSTNDNFRLAGIRPQIRFLGSRRMRAALPVLLGPCEGVEGGMCPVAVLVLWSLVVFPILVVSFAVAEPPPTQCDV